MAVYSVYITFTVCCYVLARLTPLGPSVFVEFLLIYEVSLLWRNCGCHSVIAVVQSSDLNKQQQKSHQDRWKQRYILGFCIC